MSNLRRYAELAGAILVALTVMFAYTYCQGIKRGEAKQQVSQAKDEVIKLEGEKDAIHQEVHAIDVDALRRHLLDLSQRTHEQAKLVR